MKRKSLVIAGTRGGSGKTVITMGISRVLLKRGISVAPFKKGPDYIDPGWLGAASRVKCHTIDTYLFDEQALHYVFSNSNPGCTVAILEGNRGLFDGVDSSGTHSVAELAKLLSLPVVLVVDCTKATRTIAALVRGCETLDTGLPLRGVILNNIAGERHRRIITDAMRMYCTTPVIGAVPRTEDLVLPERHMGLVTNRETLHPDDLIERIACSIEKHVDMEYLIEIINNSDLSENHVQQYTKPDVPRIHDVIKAPVTLGVFYDRAFNFYYPENLSELGQYFSKIIFIDAMRTERLPSLDALYIGGGFPEVYADVLTSNRSLMHDVRCAAENGLPIYAECGGLIYLSRSVMVGAAEYTMSGVFPYRFNISKRPSAHGYVACIADIDNPYYDTSMPFRGHEFHYSAILNENDCKNVPLVFKVERGNGISCGRDGALYKNTLATFCHTHALTENIRWMRSLGVLAGSRTASPA